MQDSNTQDDVIHDSWMHLPQSEEAEDVAMGNEYLTRRTS